MFGEDFATAGLLEGAVNVGDALRIGSAMAMVTQPREPCYKLAAKFGREDLVKRFLASGRSGFYLEVMREVEVGAGDAIELTGRDGHAFTVADVANVYRDGTGQAGLLQRALQVEALPDNWRDHFRQVIAQLRR
jgi:MOSC domain-containing protein YiiM